MRRGWRVFMPGVALLASLVLPAGCGQIVLTADDLIYIPSRPSIFVAQIERVRSAGMYDAIEDTTLSFAVDDEPIGDARTDDDGRARLVRVIELPKNARAASTIAKVGRHSYRVDRPIHRWREDKVILVIDIDHTLSQTDLDDLLMDEIDRESKPFDGSQNVVAQLAQDYQILYLTARPRFLIEKTRTWLARHDFPEAPVSTARGLGSFLAQEKVKSEMLAERREIWPNMLIGIGDRASDVEAYTSNDMLCIVLNPDSMETDAANIVRTANWQEIDQFFESNADVLRDPEQLSRMLEQNAGGELATIRGGQ